MTETTVESIKTLLIETFEGTGNEGSYFTGQNNSIVCALKDLSSEG
ncbi:hypothetical protein P5G51_005090 [Virgibacillus sp. 179-BFC.A HS]|uniref:Uncharacterized protein n=1 Tax=Tigheibacillus jepli TaxID=3035914 RepID=A0ABU5CH35_9BACI|nr:hypothetical protein [Virgibacillus sp. 179-BFC.A HS]MDY0404858.1 hypothetical protein [Virgibacillus sp. 179-BFC.A HS]